MGMFKDMKDMVNVARSDELKEMRQTAKAMPRTSMMDAMREGNAALQQATSAQALYTSGLQGQATIEGLTDTGTVLNHNPICEFQLTVTVPGRAPYPVTHQQMVPAVMLASYQPGTTMQVRVDPDDPSKLVFG